MVFALYSTFLRTLLGFLAMLGALRLLFDAADDANPYTMFATQVLIQDA